MYERDGEDDPKGSLVRWTFKFSLPNFPYQATHISAFPYFLSSSFEYMFSYNYAGKNLRIVKTETQAV